MAQPEFLLRDKWRRPARLFQASTLRAAFPEIRRTTYSNLGGFRFGHSVGTGKLNKRQLDITSPEVSSHVFRVPRSAEGVKSVLRRLRQSEAAALDDIDARIEQLQSELAGLKDRRKELLGAAWDHAHVVRLNELETLLSEPSGSI